MGTDSAPLVADLFLFYYERDFMTSLSYDNHSDIIETLNSASRYLDDLLYIDNPYFEGMSTRQMYPPELQMNPPELQMNKANTSDTEAPFWIYIYDKRDALYSNIVNFPVLDGDILRRPSYGGHISQFIRFDRVCSHVADFNDRNKCLPAKLLKRSYGIIRLERHAPCPIADTMNWFQTLMSDYNLFYIK